MDDKFRNTYKQHKYQQLQVLAEHNSIEYLSKGQLLHLIVSDELFSVKTITKKREKLGYQFSSIFYLISCLTSRRNDVRFCKLRSHPINCQLWPTSSIPIDFYTTNIEDSYCNHYCYFTYFPSMSYFSINMLINLLFSYTIFFIYYIYFYIFYVNNLCYLFNYYRQIKKIKTRLHKILK